MSDTTPDGCDGDRAWEQPDPPRVGDAFGQLLIRCWQTGARPGETIEVVERDDGLIGTADAARYFAGPDAWPTVERELLRDVRGRVLDIGCGAGRHAVALRDRGVDVIGVEPSPGAAQVSRRRGVNVVEGSVHRLPGGLGPVDEILMLGNNLGLLASTATAARILSDLAALAGPHTRIIGENMDPAGTGDPIHHAYHARNVARGRLAGQVRIRIRYQALATPFFDYLFVSPGELERLVVHTPWRVDRVHPQADGRYLVELRLRS